MNAMMNSILLKKYQIQKQLDVEQFLEQKSLNNVRKKHKLNEKAELNNLMKEAENFKCDSNMKIIADAYQDEDWLKVYAINISEAK